MGALLSALALVAAVSVSRADPGSAAAHGEPTKTSRPPGVLAEAIREGEATVALAAAARQDSLQVGRMDIQPIVRSDAGWGPCGSLCPSIRPLESGDLDADASTDLFTAELADEGWNLNARRGVDGTVLWGTRVYVNRYEFGGAWIGRFDLVGDATREILIYEVKELWKRVGSWSSGGAGASLFRQTLRLLRPHDGTEIWSSSFEGTFLLAARGPLYAAAAEEVVVDIDVMDDAGVDGRPDVFLGLLNWSGAAYESAAHYTALVLDGATGSRIGRRDWPGYPSVVPATDLSGDGRPDLIVLQEAVGYVLSAEPIAPGRPVWVKPLSDPGRYPHPHVFSLTGEPGVDVLLWADRPQLGFVTSLTAIRGRDGATLWTKNAAERNDRFEVTGDINGDGGVDLLYTAYPSWRPWEQTTLSLWAISGGTGGAIWGPRRLEPGEDDRHAFVRYGDLTGDGVSEVIVSRSVSENGQRTIRTNVIDGRDASDRWVIDELIAPTLADVNGNGTDDARRLTRQGDTQLVHFLEGSTGVQSWTAVRSRAAEYPYGTFGIDVSPAAGEEVVMWLSSFDPNDESYTYAVEAHSQWGMLWRLDGAAS